MNATVRGQDQFHSDDGSQGLISISKVHSNSTCWIEFAMKAKSTALRAGFSSDHGGKLLAAMQEFYSNVIEHSQDVGSGQIIFSSRTNRFEFVVRDRGVGIMESLRKNPEYATLNDSGTALELALQEGVSRYTEEAGHGLGFRPLFVGLANLSEYMRFRSGDHCREYYRNSNGGIEAHTKQSCAVEGFSCSVICTPTSV